MVMPVSQEHIQESKDKVFFENANLQHPRRHHEFFVRSRPYRGEPPTVAGFLLYPDNPTKMETTSREAFCFKPIPQQDRGKGHQRNTHQEAEPFHPSSSKADRRNSNSSSRGRKPGDDEQKDNKTGAVTDEPKEETTDMKSQYQKDFPPPSSCRRRRTPALPQQDNIGINPAFRIEFSTVQRETYPGWPIMNTGFVNRLGAASAGQANTTY